MSKTSLNAHLWDRSDDEWYKEPSDCTTTLLGVERFTGQIWDPACGSGSVVTACRDAYLQAFGSDIVQRVTPAPLWFVGKRDFLVDEPLPLKPNIITNPPFFKSKGTEAFIRRALSFEATRKLCIFTDVKFLAGSKRATGLFQEHPPSRVWILVPRPSCPPGTFLEAGNRAGGGTADFCWIVWDRDTPGPTQFGWLNRKPLFDTINGEAAA